jgi:hypothetical protein
MIAFDMGLESGDQLGHITNGSECALKWSVAAERAMKLIRPGEVHFKLHHYRILSTVYFLTRLHYS